MQAGINDTNREPSLKLAQKMAEVITKEETDHKDGIGYAAVDKKGDLFGERWLYNAEAFKIRESLTELDRQVIAKSCGLLKKEEKYNSFGKVDLNNITAITLHVRKSTSNKGFRNTHPFIEDNTSVIHNGTIHNFKDGKIFREGKTECDSEVILTKYNDEEVNKDIENIDGMTKEMRGQYTCGVFSLDNKNRRIMDIIKSVDGNLVCGFVKELNSLVFTSKFEHLQKACQDLDFTLLSWYLVNGKYIARLNALTGDFIEGKVFEDSGSSVRGHLGYYNNNYNSYGRDYD